MAITLSVHQIQIGFKFNFESVSIMWSRTRFIKKMKSLAIVATGGCVVFAGIGLSTGNPKFYSDIVLPTVHNLLEPETAHRFGIFIAKAGFIPTTKSVSSEILETSLWGLKFNNPIGLAAGFDKNCETLPGIFKAGFGFVEIGSVTPLPQPGNPKPRIFRLKNDFGIINRYLTTGDSQQTIYYSFHIGKLTMSKIIKETYLLLSISSILWGKITSDFNNDWQLKNCICALDGKHTH